VSRLTKPIPVVHQGRSNDCGPCSVAMASNFYLREPISRHDVAYDIRMWRVPGLKATMTPGIAQGLRKRGLIAKGGWFGRLSTLKAHVDADHPVIVLIRPTDLVGVHFLALHYRVVVGYNDSPTLPGGGELYFNCSAALPVEEEGDRPGNVVVSFARFRRQWLTWTSVNWHMAVCAGSPGAGSPGKECLGPRSLDG